MVVGDFENAKWILCCLLNIFFYFFFLNFFLIKKFQIFGLLWLWFRRTLYKIKIIYPHNLSYQQSQLIFSLCWSKLQLTFHNDKSFSGLLESHFRGIQRGWSIPISHQYHISLNGRIRSERKNDSKNLNILWFDLKIAAD